VLEPEFETNSDENRTVLDRHYSEAVGEFMELGEMDVEAGYERFGVAEISKGEAGTDRSCLVK
jgi:hypothetical protein